MDHLSELPGIEFRQEIGNPGVPWNQMRAVFEESPCLFDLSLIRASETKALMDDWMDLGARASQDHGEKLLCLSHQTGMKSDIHLCPADDRVELDSFEMLMLWHERSRRDSGHAWVREQVVAAV